MTTQTAELEDMKLCAGRHRDEADDLRVVVASQAAEIERLRTALECAAENIEHWGSYASEYFQMKWNLKRDVDAARAIWGGE